MKTISKTLLLSALFAIGLNSCSKSSNDESATNNTTPTNQSTTTNINFSSAYNGDYTGTASGTVISGDGVVTLTANDAKSAYYTGKIGNVAITDMTSTDGLNFSGKKNGTSNVITLTFSGVGNKTIKIVDGSTTFTGTKP